MTLKFQAELSWPRHLVGPLMITMIVSPETQSQGEGGKLTAQSLESSWCRAADGNAPRMSCLQNAAALVMLLREETRLCLLLPSPLLCRQMIVCSHSDEEQTCTKAVVFIFSGCRRKPPLTEGLA